MKNAKQFLNELVVSFGDSGGCHLKEIIESVTMAVNNCAQVNDDQQVYIHNYIEWMRIHPSGGVSVQERALPLAVYINTCRQ